MKSRIIFTANEDKRRSGERPLLKKKAKKTGFLLLLGLTNTFALTILTFAPNKKEFGAKTAVFDQPNATNNLINL